MKGHGQNILLTYFQKELTQRQIGSITQLDPTGSAWRGGLFGKNDFDLKLRMLKTNTHIKSSTKPEYQLPVEKK